MVSYYESGSGDQSDSTDEPDSTDPSGSDNQSDSDEEPDSIDEPNSFDKSENASENESAHAEDWGSFIHCYTLKLSPSDNQTIMYRPEQVPWEATILVCSNDFDRLMAERLTWGRLFRDSKLCDKGRRCWKHHHNGPDHFIEEGDRKKRFYLTDNRGSPCCLADIVLTARELEVLKDLSVSDLDHYMVYQAMARDPREPGVEPCYCKCTVDPVSRIWDGHRDVDDLPRVPGPGPEPCLAFIFPEMAVW
ncbi:hypothetical protein CMUS01_02757 [Colletotrichum musicola]|uniref:Uncharacterized protein n=1 Tax=Colletotrichum musicola TaxID=2175873 RepID=A0A8H6NUG6_9PEZI|nr:hypothetical protein CMUS01_02757 [Colletotrichum musicola]